MHARWTIPYAALATLLLGAGCTDATRGDGLLGVAPNQHPYFPIGDGIAHAYGKTTMSGPIDCDSCHPASATTFSQFSCNTCHEHEPSVINRVHTATSGYVSGNDACLSCHPVAEHIDFSHSGISNNCAQCHDIGTPFAALPIDNFTHPDMAGKDCGGCHEIGPSWFGNANAPAFIVVGGFTIPAPPAATPVVQGGIANLPHPGVTGACTTCHTAGTGGKRASGYDHVASAGRAQCSPCHEAGSDLVAAAWNNATSVNSGAGDTRPFTLASVVATYKGDSLTVTYPNHFYPVDCVQCHVTPAGIGTTTTGTTYRTAWKFPHTTRSMTNPSTCVMCHTRGIPD